MIGSLLLLLDIDGTLFPVGPGPDVEMSWIPYPRRESSMPTESTKNGM